MCVSNPRGEARRICQWPPFCTEGLHARDADERNAVPERQTMRTRLIFGALLLAASMACAATPRVYLVTWVAAAEGTPERRALMGKFDRQLRDES